MAGTYLEQFLESIQTLPCELKRNLILIRELDGKVDGLIKSINCESDDYINASHELAPTDKCERYNQILGLFDKAQLYTDDKKELAHQTYNIIDKHIRRLDTELAKFDELDDRSDSIKDNLCENIHNNNNNKKRGPKLAKEKSIILSNKVISKADYEKNARSKTIEMKPNSHLAKNGDILPKSELCMDMDIDPNEPLYCICQQVSFGEMVGCDDTDCPIEWFHFQCVGLTCKPKGKWYCEQCTLKKKNKQA